MSQRDVNAEGLEKSFATNVLGESNVWLRFEENINGKETWGLVMKSVFYHPLGVYILTKSLIPLLEKSADPRVVSLRHTSYVCLTLSRSPTICPSYLTVVRDSRCLQNF